MYRISVSGQAATVTALGVIPDAQPLTFDLIGKHLLYTTLTNPYNNAPPALWDATIAQDRLTYQRVVIPTAELQAGAW